MASAASLPADAAPAQRIAAPALERILGREFRVLDHGFVRAVDYMGGDAAIVQAARVSYGAGTRRARDDENLIRYLMRRRHTTPFEMCEIKLHVKLPVFVARQWIRHRTASVNEYSARYSILDREFYIPELPDIVSQSTVNRQGRGPAMEREEAKQIRTMMRNDAKRAYDRYVKMLNEDKDGNPNDENRSGAARELARIALPINIYTQWYWKIDLHNLFHFLRLRTDSHAQYEIRAYANAILDKIVRPWVPVACRAFEDYVLGGVHLSSGALEAVKRMIAGETVTQEASGLGKREWRELMAALGRDSI